MAKEEKVKAKLDFSLIGKIYELIKPHRKAFYISIIITFLASLAGPSVPMAIRHTIDNYILNLDVEGLIIMSAVVFGLLILQTILTYSQTFMTNELGQNAIMLLREKVFNHIIGFKNAVFDRTPIGSLITRTVTDVQRVADIFSQGLINIIGDLLQLIIIIAVMFATDWELSLVMMSLIPFLFAASYIFKEAVKSAFQDVRTQVSLLNAFLQEHITGMQIIQIFNREEQEYKGFDKINQAHRDANLRSVWYYSIFFPAIEIMSALGLALVVWYGAKEVIADDVTIGTLVLFLLFINMMFRPIRQIANNFNTLQMGLVASERIFKVLDREDRIEDKGTLNPIIKGKVEFKNVSFAYNDDEWILKDINLNVEAGQTIAIVGATGAGKTTITNLLNRQYDIQKGEILIDGHDIKEYSIQSLRNQIAVVLQDVFLFSDSIANNIRLYNPNLNDSEMDYAASLIGADRFIKRLPGNYEYQVQERGATLSTGQRQMISFIRAMTRDPRILILDEATSSVDQETEEMIQEAIEKMLKGRTSFVIAHRLKTIQSADLILVMDKGKVIEKGTHEELIAKEGLYKKLIKLQFTELVLG